MSVKPSTQVEIDWHEEELAEWLRVERRDEMRTLLAEGMSKAAIGRLYGLMGQRVYRILNGNK